MQGKRQDSADAQDDSAFTWDRVKAWETGEYVKALGPKIEELDKACAQVRHILYGLRKVLKPQAQPTEPTLAVPPTALKQRRPPWQ